MIRARFGSDHVGHRYVDDWGGGLYDPLELHDALDSGRRQTYEDHSDGYCAVGLGGDDARRHRAL